MALKIFDRLAELFLFWRQSRKARVVFLLAFIIFPLFIFAVTVVLPVAKNPFEASTEIDRKDETEAVADSASAEVITGRRELAKQLAALEIDHAFFQARQQLIKSGAISLAVDLIDSVAHLEVRGVPVRRCKILRYRSSGLAKRLRTQGRLHQWLSTPFILQEELATLPKAPIHIKEAPKDTIEANESKGEELAIEHRDAEFTLHFDRNLTLAVEQAQPPSFSGRWRVFWYALRRNFGAARDAIAALARLQWPQHRLWIEIELSREDAKAIYRALPPQAGLALRL